MKTNPDKLFIFQCMYNTPFEIFLEFSLDALFAYGKSTELEYVWDELTLPLITDILATLNLTSHGASIALKNDVLVYALTGIVHPPGVNFADILTILATHKRDQGVKLKKINAFAVEEVIKTPL